MGLKYTRSELAQQTGLSIETIKKRALKMGLKESFKTINNREVIAYELSDKDLADLKQALNIETPIQTNQTPFETPQESSKQSTSISEVTDKLIEFSKYSTDRLETYIERALKAESEVKLLTVTESNKDNAINELRSQVKELESIKIKQEKLKRRAVIMPIVLGVLLLVLIATFYISSAKSQDKIQAQHTQQVKLENYIKVLEKNK